MTRSEAEDTRNPAEDAQRNADQNAKAPLRDRPVAHPDHPVVGAEEGAKEKESPPDRTSEGPAPVRNAGPEEMDMPPKRWSRTDEKSDESFPASDPPGNF